MRSGAARPRHPASALLAPTSGAGRLASALLAPVICASQLAAALLAPASCAGGLASAFFARAPYAEELSDPASLSLVELMDGMASTSGVIANFREQKRIALLEEPLESSGTLYFVPPDRFARFTSRPEASLLVIDGAKLRFEHGGGAKFDLSGSPMARVFVDNFIVLFNGDLPRLQDLYHTEFSAEGETWTLILEPRGSPLRGIVKQIALRGNRRGILEIAMQDSDGDRTTTAFDAVETDVRFTDEQLEDLFVEGIQPVTASLP
jgi:outer membrane lipoprotein-sorting protein